MIISVTNFLIFGTTVFKNTEKQELLHKCNRADTKYTSYFIVYTIQNLNPKIPLICNNKDKLIKKTSTVTRRTQMKNENEPIKNTKKKIYGIHNYRKKFPN